MAHLAKIIKICLRNENQNAARDYKKTQSFNPRKFFIEKDVTQHGHDYEAKRIKHWSSLQRYATIGHRDHPH